MKETTTTTNEITPVREIVAQKVTMQMLSELPMGEKMRVVLPDIWAVCSARSTAYQAMPKLGCGFRARKLADNVIEIQKIERAC